MAHLSRKFLQEEIIVGAENIGFHPMIAYHRGNATPVILQNSEFVSYIKALVPKFVACKHCHLLFDYPSWSRGKFLMHLERMHHIATGENVNFISPIVPRNKKQIAIPEPIAILEPSPILETNSEAISLPATEEIQNNETPTESQLTLVSAEEHPLKKKKRGRKPKQAGTEKEEKKLKRNKGKKAKEDLSNSNL